jgi:hypothetical protein
MLKPYFQPFLDEDGGGGSGGLTAEQQEFLESMGLGDDEDEDEEDEDAGDEDDEDGDDEGDDSDDGDEGGDEGDKDGDKEPPKHGGQQKKPHAGQKDNAAFAKMRAENNQLKRTLDALAKGLGIPDHLSPSEKSEKISGVLTELQSKKTGVPVEVIQRLEKLEQENVSFKTKEVELHNVEAFGQIREKYGASDEDIEKFKEDLAAANFDYENTKVPLEPVFMTMYFDSIVQRRIEAKDEKEQQRKDKANKHASTPNSGKGKQEDAGGDKKIAKVTDLDEFLSQYEKK